MITNSYLWANMSCLYMVLMVACGSHEAHTTWHVPCGSVAQNCLISYVTWLLELVKRINKLNLEMIFKLLKFENWNFIRCVETPSYLCVLIIFFWERLLVIVLPLRINFTFFFLQGLAIIAFNSGKFDSKTIREVLSVGPTYFVMKFFKSNLCFLSWVSGLSKNSFSLGSVCRLWIIFSFVFGGLLGVLDIVMMYGAYSTSRRLAVTRVFVRFLSFSLLSVFICFLYVYVQASLILYLFPSFSTATLLLNAIDGTIYLVILLIISGELLTRRVTTITIQLSIKCILYFFQYMRVQSSVWVCCCTSLHVIVYRIGVMVGPWFV